MGIANVENVLVHPAIAHNQRIACETAAAMIRKATGHSVVVKWVAGRARMCLAPPPRATRRTA